MRTVWLASYPKSGNTWFRMLLANLSAQNGTPADINDLPERDGIASARAPFDYLTLIDSGLLSHDEIDTLRPRVYEALARPGAAADAGSRVRFAKVHDAYLHTPKGEPLLAGRKGGDGAIVIVRDPRDVASSLAHHWKVSTGDAIAFMAKQDAALCARPGRLDNQFRQKLRGWSDHIGGWLDQTDIPVHLVRYEDMLTGTEAVLREALVFAQRDASAEQIAGAVALASFPRLQAQERAKGFREGPRPYPDGRFFRRGEAGAWRDELTAEEVARIERDHAPMMRRLGYELAVPARLACAG
ncbi:MAG: sulfotransferase domain-containing protein [Pseudolabrys sp.]|nr:sulfotransferase domain-containing protein [Pseudolabrys sp.]MDP2295529.1 sulfotransferase domain-containing protein [Pseudolabrys sp.]